MNRPRRELGGWRLTAMVVLGVGLIRLLGLTWRIRLMNGDVPADLRAAGRPFVYVLWHGQMLPLFWHHRNQGVVIIVSEHRDGELVARVLAALGFGLVRGSTSRGGERALLNAVKELRAGKTLAVTTDGPRGPAEQLTPGALVAAQRSGVPVVPVSAWAGRAWRLRSWDRFMIPKPFARVTIAYGTPVAVAGTTAREAAADAPRFQTLLEETVARARG